MEMFAARGRKAFKENTYLLVSVLIFQSPAMKCQKP